MPTKSQMYRRSESCSQVSHTYNIKRATQYNILSNKASNIYHMAEFILSFDVLSLTWWATSVRHLRRKCLLTLDAQYICINTLNTGIYNKIYIIKHAFMQETKHTSTYYNFVQSEYTSLSACTWNGHCNKFIENHPLTQIYTQKLSLGDKTFAHIFNMRRFNEPRTTGGNK